MLQEGTSVPDVKGILFDLDNTLYDRDRTFVAWAQ